MQAKKGHSRAGTPAVRGFTLIEILTVIAIISVLLAILFPVFTTVRKKAYQTTCLGNLRQIGQAGRMYASDYDGELPYATTKWERMYPFVISDIHADLSDAEVRKIPLLTEVLLPYTKEQTLFRCPADTGLEANAYYPEIAPSRYDKFDSSYSFEFLMSDAHCAKTGDCVWAWDTSAEWHTFHNADIWNQRQNNLYLDGHVRFENKL